MTPLVLVQVFIAIAMFDVWLFRYNRPLRARGGDAQTMAEEFKVYGLPDWLLPVVRVLKLGSGVLMIVGIGYPPAAFAAGVTLIVLMGGAISMHLKVRDPLYKAMPATLFFLLSAYVTYAHRAIVSG
jgi:uncharacterized membrane protein YphA (DoxX/SURF4 family)